MSLVSLGDARGHNKKRIKRRWNKSAIVPSNTRRVARQIQSYTFNHGDGGLAAFIPPDTIRIEGDKVIGDMHVYAAFGGKDYLYEIAERAG